MDFNRNSVIALHLVGKSQMAIVTELQHLNVNKFFVHCTIKRYNETGSITKHYGGGRKRTATSAEMVRKVCKRIERNPRRSSRKLATELKISAQSVQRILQNELGLKPLKFRELHDLTSEQKKVKAKRAKELLRLATIDTSKMPAKGRGRGRKAVVAAETTETAQKVSEDTEVIQPEKRTLKRKGSKNDTDDAPVENGTVDSAPVKRGRGKANKEPTPAQRGSKRVAAASIVEDNEDQDNGEEEDEPEEPKVPAKRGRGGKKVAEQKKEPKAKRGAASKKDKEEDEVDSTTNGTDDLEPVDEEEKEEEEETKSESPPPVKKGRGRKAEVEKEERKPIKTAGAKKVISGGGRGRKRQEEIEDNDETVEAESATAPKKSRTRTTEKPAPKKKLNPTQTKYDDIDFNLDKKYNLKIASWNVAGLRSWLEKNGSEYIEKEKPDIFCLQEIKCSPDKIPEEARIPGYHPYWLCKPGGYAGVALYSKIMPINVEYGLGDEEQDADGRILTAEYEKFFLIVVYVPNAGRKLVTLPKRMRWDKLFQDYIVKLNKKKPVIIAGDMNVSHTEIDLANPKTNKKSAGFTQEERDGMTKMLSLGFVDTFRHFYPNLEKAYTYWTYMANARAKNVGWRLDYFIISEKFMPKVVDNVIRSQVLGSDHCPITLFLDL